MDVIAIIPAAGQGSRLHPFRYPKELFPILYRQNEGGRDDVRLKVVCQYVLENLVAAGVQRAYVVVSDHKFDIMRFLSDGQEYNLHLAYLHQRTLNGLPFAIDCAYAWMREHVSVLVLPDTVVVPGDAVQQMLDCLVGSRADVVLGVFPTEHPGDLCPVHYDAKGRVLALYDKDARCEIKNTWGMAAWRPRFAEFLHLYLQESRPAGREMALAEVFTRALEAGLDVRAFPVPGGKFWDIGTRSSLAQARRTLENDPL